LLFFFIILSYAAHRDLHSFPTRTLFRSRIDKTVKLSLQNHAQRSPTPPVGAVRNPRHWFITDSLQHITIKTSQEIGMKQTQYVRSEEHTSELQSRGHLVCRLLLEKKKKY